MSRSYDCVSRLISFYQTPGSILVDRITLHITHMDIEEGSPSTGERCPHDYVRVLQGDNENAPEVGKYCGTSAPAPITSNGNALTVTFTSDASVARTGFIASFSKSTSCKYSCTGY